LVTDGCGDTASAVVLVVATMPTDAELASVEPPVLVAVSTTMMKLPTSPGPRV
jgi:hypothetical protein